MTEQRKGDWFQTYPSRKRFYILDPRPEDVDIKDIAHSLAMKCRYGGHCAYFYTVAEHSVLVSHVVPAHLALAALLHDAAEAYTGDIMRPIKESIGPEWRVVEAQLDAVICEVFGVDSLSDPLIKEYDSRMLTDERLVLQHPVLEGKSYGDKLNVAIQCLTWQDAEAAFMARFDELMHRSTTKAPMLTPHITDQQARDIMDGRTPIPKFLREPKDAARHE